MTNPRPDSSSGKPKKTVKDMTPRLQKEAAEVAMTRSSVAKRENDATKREQFEIVEELSSILASRRGKVTFTTEDGDRLISRTLCCLH